MTNGTVYVLTHSVYEGYAPGNALIDVDAGAGAAMLEEGDAIEIGGLASRVTSSMATAKTDLPREADVWSDEPGRLVVITCLQRDGAGSVDNVVIFAELDQG